VFFIALTRIPLRSSGLRLFAEASGLAGQSFRGKNIEGGDGQGE
jgi:hypothetical protein